MCVNFMKINKSDTVKSLKRSAIKFSRNMFGNEIFPGLWFIPGGPGRKPGNLWGSLVANIGVMAPPPQWKGLPEHADLLLFMCANYQEHEFNIPGNYLQFPLWKHCCIFACHVFIREGFISHFDSRAKVQIITPPAEAFQRDRFIIGAVKCLLF